MKAIERRIEQLEARVPTSSQAAARWQRLSKREQAIRLMDVMTRPAYPGATDADRQAAEKLLAVFFPGLTADQLKSRMDDERRQPRTSGGSPQTDAPPQADQYAARNDAFKQYLNERSAPSEGI
jgi:D-serine deaminase-like pyridoxal phosphate-dependent protein